MSDRTKAMDNLIAQDADLIDAPSLVTEADREVLIRLSNPNDETAQRIRRGLIYTWEARQIANHREQAAAEERAKIVAWMRETQEAFQKLMDLGKHPLVSKHHMEHCKHSAEAIEAGEHLK